MLKNYLTRLNIKLFNLKIIKYDVLHAVKFIFSVYKYVVGCSQRGQRHKRSAGVLSSAVPRLIKKISFETSLI